LPVTPLHYPIAKIIHQFGGKASLSLPALIVGSMVPDLEVPFVYFLSGTWDQDRMVLHSLIGGLTLGTLIAVALTVLLYPRVMRVIFPLNKERVKEKCRFSLALVFSCFIGVLSHVLLDVANHTYNHLFWPFLSLFETPSPIVPLLGGGATASLIIHGSMIILSLAIIVIIFVRSREALWNKLFVE